MVISYVSPGIRGGVIFVRFLLLLFGLKLGGDYLEQKRKILENVPKINVKSKPYSGENLKIKLGPVFPSTLDQERGRNSPPAKLAIASRITLRFIGHAEMTPTPYPYNIITIP